MRSLSLRRRALLKVSLIFVLFVIYSILNIVYIVMFNKYAVLASDQYNDIQMRRPLMSEVALMCRQAFFENDTHYLVSSTTSSVKYLPEYRNRLLAVEASILDFEKSGPQFIFPGYIKKLKTYNGAQFCSELQPLISSDTGCATYDNGFLQNGLRASQFRFMTFWQGIAQNFLTDTNLNSSQVLAGYRYDSDITITSN